MTARVFTLLAAIAVGACGGAPLPVAALSAVERVRATEGAKEGAALAPEAYARAQQERDLALPSYASGDPVAATLHPDRGVAKGGPRPGGGLPATGSQGAIGAAGGGRPHWPGGPTRGGRGGGHRGGRGRLVAAGPSAAGGGDPARDERGVVVTLRGLFHGI